MAHDLAELHRRMVRQDHEAALVLAAGFDLGSWQQQRSRISSLVIQYEASRREVSRLPEDTQQDMARLVADLKSKLRRFS